MEKMEKVVKKFNQTLKDEERSEGITVQLKVNININKFNIDFRIVEK